MLDGSVIEELKSQVSALKREAEAEAMRRAEEQLAHLHQSEISSPEPNILALLSRIRGTKKIGMETWLRDHAQIRRSTFMDWKRAASGKPVKRKVSVAKAREFEATIRREAMELELNVHDNVHDV